MKAELAEFRRRRRLHYQAEARANETSTRPQCPQCRRIKTVRRPVWSLAAWWCEHCRIAWSDDANHLDRG